jgi:hypothetical protein
MPKAPSRDGDPCLVPPDRVDRCGGTRSGLERPEPSTSRTTSNGHRRRGRRGHPDEGRARERPRMVGVNPVVEDNHENDDDQDEDEDNDDQG